MFVGLASLALAALIVVRVVRAGLRETRLVAAVGLTRRQRGQAELLLVLSATAVGVLAVLAIAWAVSPAFPVGLARTVEPDPGPYSSWLTVAGAVGLLLVVAVVALAVAAGSLRRETRVGGSPKPHDVLMPGLPFTTSLGVGGAFRRGTGAEGGAALRCYGPRVRWRSWV